MLHSFGYGLWAVSDFTITRSECLKELLKHGCFTGARHLRDGCHDSFVAHDLVQRVLEARRAVRKDHFRYDILQEGVLPLLGDLLEMLAKVLSRKAWRADDDTAHLGVGVLSLEVGLELLDDLIEESVFRLNVLVVESLCRFLRHIFRDFAL